MEAQEAPQGKEVAQDFDKKRGKKNGQNLNEKKRGARA